MTNLSSNILATWCEELTHWKRRPWCWERLRAKGEEHAEDEMVSWHHQLNEREFEQAPGDSGGQKSLLCYSPWVTKSGTQWGTYPRQEFSSLLSLSIWTGETPILWPADAKTWLIWKDPDAGKDWGQEEKGMTEDEMVGWHHRLNGHGFGWTPGVGDGQGGLACCGSWGCKESYMTERLNLTELNRNLILWAYKNRNLLLIVLYADKSMIKVLANSVSGEILLPGS